MRYTTERLPADDTQRAHMANLADRNGRGLAGNDGPVPHTDFDHVVIDNMAHPINRIVCYAQRAMAEQIAGLLNNQAVVNQNQDRKAAHLL